MAVQRPGARGTEDPLRIKSIQNLWSGQLYPPFVLLLKTANVPKNSIYEIDFVVVLTTVLTTELTTYKRPIKDLFVKHPFISASWIDRHQCARTSAHRWWQWRHSHTRYNHQQYYRRITYWAYYNHRQGSLRLPNINFSHHFVPFFAILQLALQATLRFAILWSILWHLT